MEVHETRVGGSGLRLMLEIMLFIVGVGLFTIIYIYPLSLLWVVGLITMGMGGSLLMRGNVKGIVGFIILGMIVGPLTLYTWLAIDAMRYVFVWDGTPVWLTRPAGSFFPIPHSPGIFQAITEMNPVDQFIYKYLLSTFIIPILTLSLWVIMVFLVIRTPREGFLTRDER